MRAIGLLALAVFPVAGIAQEPAPAGPAGCEALVGRVLDTVAGRHHDPATRARAKTLDPGAACAGGTHPRAAVARTLAPLDDPAIRLLDIAHFERMLAEWTGAPVVGVGLTEVLSIDVDEATRRLTVIAPVPGTPAAEAGLSAGDVVEEIDGVPTDGLGLTRAAERLRVSAGETVRLGILRGDERLEVALTADPCPGSSPSSPSASPRTAWISWSSGSASSRPAPRRPSGRWSSRPGRRTGSRSTCGTTRAGSWTSWWRRPACSSSPARRSRASSVPSPSGSGSPPMPPRSRRRSR